MKKKNIYIVAVILLIVATGAIVYGYQQKQKENENRIYVLLERKGASAQTKEWAEVQTKANTLIEALKVEPNDIKSALSLAALYIQEARETGNYVYYDQAAMKYVNTVLKVDTANFEALVFKSLVFMSQHHFAEGLETAKKAQHVNPYNAYVYGLMVDGYVEMGNYDSAITNADRMVAIRPDLTSYARVSYLREIYGDYKGAIEAMRMAVTAGGPGDEHTEWTRSQLAGLYEKTADYRSADSLYNISLTLRPDYPFALAGLARVAMASQNNPVAIQYFQKADSLITDNTIKEELAEAYEAAGQKDKANQVYKSLIEDLQKDADAGNADENVGHYTDRELAYAYLKINDVDKALEHAMLEYNRRPDNIDVNETVAWVLYRKGDYAKALPYIKTALKTNSKNPVLLSRAGLIFYKSGDKQQAKNMLSQTSATNPYISPALKQEVSAAMQSI